MLTYWEKESGLLECDFLVVGMGLVGMQLAIRLKESEPKARVVIVDKNTWGGGASLRNAGFACFANASEILHDLENQSEEEVIETIKSRYQGLNLLRHHLTDEKIGYRPSGSKEVFFEEQKEALSKALDQLQYLNGLCEAATGIQRVFTYSYVPGSGNAGQITNKEEGVLHTGKLYARLWQKLREAGVEILGGMEFRGYDSEERVTAHFQGGKHMETRHLFICTNGFPIPSLSEDVFPARGTVLVTEELKDVEIEAALFNDGGYYYWRSINNRVLLGGGRHLAVEDEKTTSLDANPIIESALREFLFERITHKTVKIDHVWSGTMGMGEHSKKPIVKSLECNVHIAIRLGGMGVALSANVAQEAMNLIRK
jgi:gamma-glutamylputrescine oxidase